MICWRAYKQDFLASLWKLTFDELNTTSSWCYFFWCSRSHPSLHTFWDILQDVWCNFVYCGFGSFLRFHLMGAIDHKIFSYLNYQPRRSLKPWCQEIVEVFTIICSFYCFIKNMIILPIKIGKTKQHDTVLNDKLDFHTNLY